MNADLAPQLFHHDKAPAPTPHKVGWVHLDGIRLRYAHWKADLSNYKGDVEEDKLGTVLICTGRNEFIEKYYEVASDLLKRGHSVVVFDWRGQGFSSRLLKKSRAGHVTSFNDYVRDFHAMFDQVLLPDCRAPFYVLAHSMGGLISLLAASEVPQRVERMVLSAPLLKIKGLPLNDSTMQHVSGFIKLLGLGGLPTYRKKDWAEITPFEVNVLTGSRTRYARNSHFLRLFPDIGVGCPSFSWLNAALKAMAHIHSSEFMDNFAVPTLMFSASGDQVVSSEAIDLYCADMPYCYHLSINGAEHEILQEQDALRADFFAGFKAFIPGSAN